MNGLLNVIVNVIGITLLGSALLGCNGSDNKSDDDAGLNNDQDTGTLPPANSNPASPLEEGLIGPIGGSGADGEYSQFNDSPLGHLDFSRGYFYFEDFEDGVFEHPGASASAGDFVTPEFGDTFHDSVDEDDGLIDGNSLDGESWFSADSDTGIVWWTTYNGDIRGNS